MSNKTSVCERPRGNEKGYIETGNMIRENFEGEKESTIRKPNEK